MSVPLRRSLLMYITSNVKQLLMAVVVTTLCCSAAVTVDAALSSSSIYSLPISSFDGETSGSVSTQIFMNMTKPVQFDRRSTLSSKSQLPSLIGTDLSPRDALRLKLTLRSIEEAPFRSRISKERLDFQTIGSTGRPQFAQGLLTSQLLPSSLGLSQEDVEVIETKIKISGDARNRKVRLKVLAKLIYASKHVLGVRAVKSGGKPSISFDSVSVVIRCRMALPKTHALRNAFFQRLRSSLMNSSPGSRQIVNGLPSFEIVKAKTKGYIWKSLKTPNIVVFMTDDQGWEDVGWRYGTMRSPTPNLDVFRNVASELMQMYTAPLCSPSRAMFFTGRLAHHTGYGPAVTEGILNHLSGNETLIGEILKANGYHCALFGKWHLGIFEKRNRPENRGFDTVFGEGSIAYTSRVNTLTFNDKSISIRLQDNFSTASGVSLFNGTDVGHVGSYSGRKIPLYNDDEAAGNQNKHQVDLLEEEILRFLESYSGSDQNSMPLFGFVGSRMPHTPLIPPARYHSSPRLRHLFRGGTRWRKQYLMMVHAADAVFGKIVAKLEDVGMWKDTVFMFLTDNGGLSTMRGGASNKPLQGRKNLLWEGGIRVINLISGTGSSLAPLDENAKGGKNYDLMHFVDWLPTLCSGVARIRDYSNAWKCRTCTRHKNKPLDGLNLWDSIQAGGTESIENSTRVLPLQVIPLLQAKVASGKVPITRVLPRTSYDVQVYNGTQFESTLDFEKSDLRLRNHIKRFRKHGGGAIRMGRYKLMLANNGRCVPDNPWECQAHKDRQLVRAEEGSLNYWLHQYVPESLNNGKLPGHASNLGYLYDIWKDPVEENNLLLSKLSLQAREALQTMLQRYAAEQLDAVLDGKITHGFAADPAVAWFVNAHNAFSGGCIFSIHCNYE